MSLKQKHDDFLLDHPIIKTILSYFWTILGSALAAFCIAYCFRAFVEPETSTEHYNLIAGGVNGVNQVITIAFPSFVNYLVKFWRINYKIINQY